MGFPFRRRHNRRARERPRSLPAARPPLPPPPDEPAPVPPSVAAVGEEVEAFLGGRLVDHCVAERRPVPAWAVLNELAHATGEELAALASPPVAAAAPAAPAQDAAGGGTDEPRWRREQRALAARLLEDAPTPDRLADVQRRALVPLELWAIERSRRTTVTSRCVLEMAAAVLDALRADR